MHLGDEAKIRAASNSNLVLFAPNPRLQWRSCVSTVEHVAMCCVFGCFEISVMILDPGSRPFLLRHICGGCFARSAISNLRGS